MRTTTRRLLRRLLTAVVALLVLTGLTAAPAGAAPLSTSYTWSAVRCGNYLTYGGAATGYTGCLRWLIQTNTATNQRRVAEVQFTTNTCNYPDPRVWRMSVSQKYDSTTGQNFGYDIWQGGPYCNFTYTTTAPYASIGHNLYLVVHMASADGWNWPTIDAGIAGPNDNKCTYWNSSLQAYACDANYTHVF